MRLNWTDGRHIGVIDAVVEQLSKKLGGPSSNPLMIRQCMASAVYEVAYLHACNFVLSNSSTQLQRQQQLSNDRISKYVVKICKIPWLLFPYALSQIKRNKIIIQHQQGNRVVAAPCGELFSAIDYPNYGAKDILSGISEKGFLPAISFSFNPPPDRK